jgi:hypothetical protein
MYSCVVARIKDETEYQWFKYTGRPIEIPFRGITRTMETGQKFGVRKSSSGKLIRLVFDQDLTRVSTIDLPLAKKLAKACKVLKG